MSAIVLFSGGLDSYATLLMAMQRKHVVELAHVQYGQQHGSQEAVAARYLAAYHDVPLRTFNVPLGALPKVGPVVLGRNSILLTIAAARAAQLGVGEVWTGVCQADAAAFPDCRREFIAAQAIALQEAMDLPLCIVAPLLNVSKAETFEVCARFLRLEVALDKTHTCYEGVRTRQAWGRGCGECQACQVRRNGWLVYSQQASG